MFFLNLSIWPLNSKFFLCLSAVMYKIFVAMEPRRSE